MSRYQTLCVVTVIATLVLITVGSLVRTTGSGLGCPDWPLCHGRPYPPLERTALIEYSHRTTAAVVGALIVATAITTFRVRRGDRTIRVLAAVSLPLLALQAWLGKVTVERELPAEVVTFHLSTAMLLLAVLAVIATLALLGAGRSLIATPERRRFARLSVIAAATTALIVVIGSYLVGSDAGYACTSWPHCPEAQIPFLQGGRLQSIHWVHRFSVIAGIATVSIVVANVRRMQDPGPWLSRGAKLLVNLYALQIVSGALNIFSDFADDARVLHLALGSTIWALLIALTVAGRYRRGEERVPLPSSARAREASGARA